MSGDQSAAANLPRSHFGSHLGGEDCCLKLFGLSRENEVNGIHWFVERPAKQPLPLLQQKKQLPECARWAPAGSSRKIRLHLNEADLNILKAIPIRKSVPFRIFSAGRLLHWKGFHLGIEAFSRLLTEFPDSEYWVMGDGPERQRLEKLVKRLGIAHRVTFFGNISRSETFQKISGCDVMLFPSLHDSGGWASVESMAAGRPIVCLDLGGPALQVDTATGFKIPAIHPAQATRKITEALISLASNPTLRSAYGGGMPGARSE